MDTTQIAFIAFGVIIAAIWVVMMAVNPRSGLYAVALMVFLSSIGVAFNWLGNIYGSWLLPLQEQRSYLFLAVGSTLALGMAAHLTSLRPAKVSGQAVFLVVNGLYIGLMYCYHVGFIDGMQTMALAAIAIFALALVCALSLEEIDDWYRVIRLVAFGLAGFVFCVAVQIARDRSRIMNDSDRFIGVGANPQLVATFLALTIVPVVWLLINDRSRRLRPIWWGLGALAIIGLLATGSRTGMAMLVLGLGCISVRRFGRTAIAIPIAGFALFVALRIADALGIPLPLSRFLSTENTRSAAWQILIEQFFASPIFGNGIESTEKSENSFLYAAASYGVGMLALVATFAVYSVWCSLRLFWRTRPYPQLHSLVDLIIAINVMYFAGAVFEGYMISRVSSPLVMIVLAGSMSAAMLYQLQRQEAGEVYFTPHADDLDEHEAWDDDEVWDDEYLDDYAGSPA
ncbi:MAG: hypothetical protein AAF432_14340 [Planctomycetota bacterium]